MLEADTCQADIIIFTTTCMRQSSISGINNMLEAHACLADIIFALLLDISHLLEADACLANIILTNKCLRQRHI